MIRKFVPVYLITGFIESGKTTLGLTILGNERFTNGGKTLVICCEDGEAEWDDKSLEKNNGVLVMLDSSEELNSRLLADLENEHKPSCVIMEYNSMWGLEKLDTLILPHLWDWAQVVTTADGTTFENYMTNMRKLLTDPMKTADMITVNRCGPDFNKSSWRKQLRAMNNAATIFFENLDGTVDDGIRDEDLPYDMKAETISIAEDQFGIFYVDSMDHPERYHGKRIRIVGHTDNIGSDRSNQILSEGRCEEVKRAMIERGIAPERIEISGRGERDPIMPNDSDEHRQMNRRVEIVLL